MLSNLKKDFIGIAVAIICLVVAFLLPLRYPHFSIPYLDWILFIMNIVYVYPLSRKKKIGNWLMLYTQILWILFAMPLNQLGITLLGLVYFIIAINGILKWEN